MASGNRSSGKKYMHLSDKGPDCRMIYVQKNVHQTFGRVEKNSFGSCALKTIEETSKRRDESPDDMI